MKKNIKSMLAGAFALCAVTGAAHAGECHATTEKPMDITELSGMLAPNRALGMIILFEPGSELLKKINSVLPDQYGAILNDLSNGNMEFDPATARKLNDKTFESMPIIIAQGCLKEPGLLTDALKELQKINGIKAVTFDVKLYEPLQPATPSGP